MIQSQQCLVLRTIKYGETSLIATALTHDKGVQTFMLKGVRKGTKNRSPRAGLWQPGSQLQVVAYNRPGQNMHLVREFEPALLYQTIGEDIVKNSVAVFAIEILLRLLPPDAPAPEVFDFATAFLCDTDRLPNDSCAHLPLYFLIHCGALMGYAVSGSYSERTPYLDLTEGGFTEYPPVAGTPLSENDVRLMNVLLTAPTLLDSVTVMAPADARQRVLDWYLAFLQRHTQHLGQIRSLPVLRSVLH
jgi:DNA repair protein RecO (recombination protein O)